MRWKKEDILVLGKGMIGRRLQEEWGCPVSVKKIAGYEDVEQIIREHKPKVIVNCIGHTGKNNVDDCEAALDKTVTANTFVPILLGEAALRHGIKLVHIGSGCIYHYDYDKQRPISESRPPDFLELYYSRTKIYAEKMLLTLSKRADILILRIRVPLDDRPDPRNILTKMKSFKSIIDIPNSVTYIPDLIKTIRYLIEHDQQGLFNAVCKGGLKYSNLMKEYQRYHPEVRYEVVKPEKLNKTRTNLILSTKKLEKTGFKVRTIDTVVRECVSEFVKKEEELANT